MTIVSFFLAIFEHILRTMEMFNKPPHTFSLFTFSPPVHLSTDLAFQMTSIVSCKISRLWPLNERHKQPVEADQCLHKMHEGLTVDFK